MDISKVTISCAKSDCPGGSSVHQTHCGVCDTPVVKRYLRVLHPPKGSLNTGTLLEGRYWVTNFADIVLDTQPQERPFVTDEFSSEIISYLKLSPQMLHCPKIFGLTGPNGLWLLEYASINLDASGLPTHPGLFASMVEVWKSAEPLQQLNWLAQIAGLLPDLQAEGAVGTVYDLSLLGINGGVVQIRELLCDRQQNIDFQKLGQVWRELLEHPDKSIKKFCGQLYQSLKQGTIHDVQMLIATLNAGIIELGQSNYEYRYEIYTQTDAGPTRKHNEDACFPAAGRIYQNYPLAIVCDGIGGHDKGEVASAIAIETIQKHVANIQADASRVTPDQRKEMLREFVLRANDAISDQNDQEQRTERARMGTTVVMSWTEKPHLYLTHVGDSRIYRITTDSCHQVTYDDDLGSREVRLGYALYQDALSYPSAGALVQALGMSPSQSLHPTVQKLVPDRDAVYLLCSDGLSDYHRVEGHWRSEIVPLLQGKGNLQQLGERLIAIANTENGHDNATIALLYVRLRRKPDAPAIAFPNLLESSVEPPPAEPVQDSLPITEASAPPPSRRSNQWLLVLVGLLGVTGIGLLSWEMWRRSQVDSPVVIDPPPAIEAVPIPEVPLDKPPIIIPGDTPPEGEPSPLTKNQILQLQADTTITAFYTPQAIANPDAPTVTIPGGSIVRIEQINADNQVLLELCQLPTDSASPDSTIKILAEGNRGWSPQSTVKEKLDPSFIVGTETICGNETNEVTPPSATPPGAG